jgi:hypothetical protein
MSKNYAIINGSWTKEKNYSGYNSKGERVHIYAEQMKNAGFEFDSKVPPLFVIGATKSYPKTDDKGNPTGEEFTRLTALAVFKTQEEMVNAHMADAKLNVAIKAAVKDLGITAGFGDEEMAELLSASI